MSQHTMWSKERGLRTLKEGISIEAYQAKYPSAIKVSVPSMAHLEHYVSHAICPTPDHCRVEPDGVCSHGYPSWLLILGYI